MADGFTYAVTHLRQLFCFVAIHVYYSVTLLAKSEEITADQLFQLKLTVNELL